MIELVFLTNSSVSCFSCVRSSSERQLPFGDKTKTISCREIIKVDDVLLQGTILSSPVTWKGSELIAVVFWIVKGKRIAFYREIVNRFISFASRPIKIVSTNDNETSSNNTGKFIFYFFSCQKSWWDMERSNLFLFTRTELRET